MKTHPFEELCGRFRRRLRGLVLRLAVSRVVVVALVLPALLIGADYLLRFGTSGRAAMLALFVAGAAAIIFREVRASRRRPWSDRDVLVWLDAADVEGGDRLVNLYEMASPENIGEAVTPEGRAILELATRRLEPALKAQDGRAAFEFTAVRRWTLGATAAAACVIAFALIYPHAAMTGLGRLFQPFAHIRWSALTRLAIESPANGWLVPQGESLSLRVKVEGERPAEVQLSYKSKSTGYWVSEHAAVGADGVVTHTFEEVNEPLAFYIKGGDDETDVIDVDIIVKPRLKRATAFYEYPAYAGLQNQKVESGELRGLEGATVKVEFESTTPLKSATFVLEGQPEESLPLTTPTIFSKEMILRENGSYRIQLIDEHGFKQTKPEHFGIQVIPDAPPEARIAAPGRELVATSQAKVAFAFDASDDFGLTSVQFMYSRAAGDAAEALSDKITGPIVQKGKQSHAEFTWDFAEMKLKGSTTLEYFVRANDCNPTGRGQTDSAHFHITLLPPTEFHNQILYEMRRILAEARAACRDQKAAYWKSLDWTKAPSGNPDDEKWRELEELQDKTLLAAEDIGRWFNELHEHIARNHMEDDFMQNRLDSIVEAWRGARELSSHTAAAFGAARPRTAADAQAERLKGARLKLLQENSEGQKNAALRFTVLLRKLYDWENLETALVNTKLLRERQGEISSITRQLAPSTIGKEAEDLDDKTLDKVLTLAQQQSAAMETETGLEGELAGQAVKADKDGRRAVKQHLLLALGYLKDKKISTLLKRSVERLRNNQLADVAADQLTVEASLKIVEAGLIKAGRDARDQDQFDAVAALKPDADVEENKPAAAAEAAKEDTDVAVTEEKIKAVLAEVLPAGKDTLSQTLLTFTEMEDTVKLRTAYLRESFKPTDIPRYHRLQLALLAYWQDAAARFIAEKLAPKLAESEFRALLQPQGQAFLAQARAAHAALKLGDVSEAGQRLQEDLIESARDLVQFLARQKQAQDAAADRLQKGEMDDFKRPYLLRGDDAKQALALYQSLDWSRYLQAGAARKTAWAAERAAGKLHWPTQLDAAATELLDASAKAQTEAAQALAAYKEPAGFSETAKPRVAELGLAALPALELLAAAPAIAKGQPDVALGERQAQTVAKLNEALVRLKDLMDERAAPPDAPAAVTADASPAAKPATKVEEKVFVTEADIAKEMTPEAIRGGLKESKALAEPLKARMLQTLPTEFPAKYKRMMGAYYRTLIEPAEKGER